MEIAKLLTDIKEINPKADVELIRHAYNFAKDTYGNAKRLSGQTLLDHCLEIAYHVAQIKLDTACIAATILHETTEKCNVDIKTIAKEFGTDVANLVEGVTNVSKVEHYGAKRNTENLRKLFLAMARDLRVILIKLVNRVHGLKTIDVFPPEKQKRLAQETLEIYSPLANRLGMGQIQAQLEDLAFPYVYPAQHQWLQLQIKVKYEAKEKEISKIKALVRKELEKNDVSIIDIYGRTKHLYSLWRKLQRYDMDMSRIYDLLAIRVILNSVDDCYKAMGLIHKICKPMPGRIKDYIASPKPNGYQSLHTTVFGPNDIIAEIQIRTNEMHQRAEYGVASHWYYSERKGFRDYLRRLISKSPKELAWVDEMAKRQKSIVNSESTIEDLKIDFLKDRIFVFTPQGDVLDLPDKSTPIDFAYYVHSEIGNTFVGAKINDAIVSMDTELKNGDVVEIITSPSAHPTQKWLSVANSSLARHHIRHWVNTQFKQPINPSLTSAIIKKAKDLIPKRITLIKSTPEIEFDGSTKVPIHLAKCCDPTYPIPIKGYITVEHGISVHRADCRSLNKNKNHRRVIPVKWRQK